MYMACVLSLKKIKETTLAYVINRYVILLARKTRSCDVLVEEVCQLNYQRIVNLEKIWEIVPLRQKKCPCILWGFQRVKFFRFSISLNGVLTGAKETIFFSLHVCKRLKWHTQTVSFLFNYFWKFHKYQKFRLWVPKKCLLKLNKFISKCAWPTENLAWLWFYIEVFIKLSLKPVQWLKTLNFSILCSLVNKTNPYMPELDVWFR